MTDKSDWQKANRELIAEERRKLGDPPTAEELLAYSRGELPESEEERIRDLIVAYPELARMWAEPAPEAPQPGDPDWVPEEQVTAAWRALQQRLRPRPAGGSADARDRAQRGQLHNMPTSLAAALALIFFGLYVHAEWRVRDHARYGRMPRVLVAPQELDADARRGAATPHVLRNEGNEYWLKPRLLEPSQHPHHRIELVEVPGGEVIWSSSHAQPDPENAFLIVVPREFLRGGATYRLRILGIDGEKSRLLAAYDFSAPAE